MTIPMLETRGLTARYGDFQALYGIDTVIAPGETIAIIGANGAGKSSYLKAIAGLVRAEPGSVLFEGRPIGALGAANVLKLGIAMVPEGRRLFASLTVEENLLIGNYGRKVAGDMVARQRLCAVSGAEGPPCRAKPDLVRRRAADGRDRARVDVEPARAAL